MGTGGNRVDTGRMVRRIAADPAGRIRVRSGNFGPASPSSGLQVAVLAGGPGPPGGHGGGMKDGVRAGRPPARRLAGPAAQHILFFLRYIKTDQIYHSILRHLYYF